LAPPRLSPYSSSPAGVKLLIRLMEITNFHETGSAINTISSHYHPGPYANPSDYGLYPGKHHDVGPAMEDCVGRKYYKAKGLKPTY
jgi:hypothetical protein